MNDEQLCSIALTKIKGLGLTGAKLIYEAAGSATAIYEHRKDIRTLLPEVTDKAGELVRHMDGAMKEAEQELLFAQKHDINVLTMRDESYPARLKMCEDAPLVLYYKGTESLNGRHILSVVGTRRCSDYGKALCAKLTRELGEMMPDITIVSGLAYGVDIHAHRGALDAGLPTIGVLAHGLDRIYPVLHRDTAKKMVTQGGLLTEYPSGTKPDKGNFVQRNRIIAGLCDACVVVESAAKGGALITARLAQDYNRLVYAFPGRVGDETSEGCNRLIFHNVASLLENARSLLEDLGWKTREKRKKNIIEGELFPDLSAEEQVIVNTLKKEGEAQINRLVVDSGMGIQQLSALLFELEMKGLVRVLAGGIYKLSL